MMQSDKNAQNDAIYRKESQNMYFLCILFRLMTGTLYPQHILYVKATEMAFEDAIHLRSWSEAVDYGSLCLSTYKKYSIGDQVISLERPPLMTRLLLKSPE